jgi:hypothetical protein
MNENIVKIGEHVFQFKNHSSELDDFCNKNFTRVSEYINNSIDMTIEIMSGFGVPFLNYEVKTTKSINRITFERADYFIEVDPEFTHAKLHVNNDLALKHALMNLYSCYIVHINWGVLIHSSCVIERNKAHIFSGKSGAGKSTAARLSYPRSLLSDEATILKITADEIIAYDSPFRSEITSKSELEYYSIGSIHLLHQSLTNKRTEITKSDSFLLLLDKVFYWTYNPEETKKIFALLKEIVDHVPVYDLFFQKNNTFWEMIS